MKTEKNFESSQAQSSDM